MKVTMIQNLFFAMLLLILTSCGGNQEHQHQSTGKETNYDCSYCGMPSQEFPQWNVKMLSEKGEHWFCSPRCMFLTILDKENAPSDIQSIQVTDYYESSKIDGQKAFYVIKSDVIGPMGHDLVPFLEESAAQEFQKEHGGEKVLNYSEVSLDTVKELVNQ